MQQCRIDALLPTRVEANAFCDLIGGFEADTAYLTESIRVLTKAIKEYIAEQLKRDRETDQLSIFDPPDPFKGGR